MSKEIYVDEDDSVIVIDDSNYDYDIYDIINWSNGDYVPQKEVINPKNEKNEKNS